MSTENSPTGRGCHLRWRVIFSLGFKNLTRYWRRTIITSITLAIGVLGFIIMDSMLVGLEQESERNLIQYDTATGRLYHEGYWDEHERLPLEPLIEDPEAVLARLDEIGIAAAPRVVFRGELITYRDPYVEDGSISTRIFGIDPLRDAEVFDLEETVTAGRYLEADDEGVLLGQWLAEDLGAEVGFPLLISTRTQRGYLQTIEVPIIGIIDCPDPTINRTGVFIPLRAVDIYLQMEGSVTEIALRIREDGPNLDYGAVQSTLFNAPLREAYEALEQITAEEPTLQFVPRTELASGYYLLAQAKEGSSGIFYLLIFVIAAVGISNTMLMSTYERMPEIGMMRALGASVQSVRRLFLCEAGGIGLLGSIIGVALGVLLNIPLVNRGIDYGDLIRNFDVGYRVASVFHGAWNIGGIINIAIVGVIISVVVAIFPVRRALTRDIPRCLHNN